MCYDEGTLETYLDEELAGADRQALEEHIKSCPACRCLLDRLRQDQAFATAKTRAYLGAFEGDRKKAWHKLEEAMIQANGEIPNILQYNRKGVLHMVSKYRKMIATGAAVAVLGFSLTFTPVRTFAANLLNIFRVNEIQSVSLNPADFNQIEQALRQGAGKVTLGDLGQVEMQKTGQPGEVSLSDAQKAVDFPLRLPANLPPGYSKAGTRESTGGAVSFTLNTQKTNGVLKDLGATTLLPDSLNGKTFTINIPVIVQTTYKGAGTLVVAEARSPELTVPGDADVGAIRAALLALPFLPDNLRQQLMAINDWQHTLIIPSLKGTSQNVTVAGAQGVYVTAPQGSDNEVDQAHSALIWQKDGVVYALGGNFSVEEGLSIANSMQ